MALANRIEWQADLPHEPGQWFKFRRLSARQLEKARNLRQKLAIQNTLQDTPELVELLKGSVSNPDRAARDDRDPLEAYDRWALLRDGLVDWSYDEALSPDSIEALDEQTLDWACRQLIPLPLPEDARLSMFR